LWQKGSTPRRVAVLVDVERVLADHPPLWFVFDDGARPMSAAVDPFLRG
jgi:hypothetical protein